MAKETQRLKGRFTLTVIYTTDSSVRDAKIVAEECLSYLACHAAGEGLLSDANGVLEVDEWAHRVEVQVGRMRGIYEIMAANARQAGRDVYRFVVDLDVEPQGVRDEYGDRETPIAELLKGEIESWLESLNYIQGYSVRRKF